MRGGTPISSPAASAASTVFIVTAAASQHSEQEEQGQRRENRVERDQSDELAMVHEPDPREHFGKDRPRRAITRTSMRWR